MNTALYIEINVICIAVLLIIAFRMYSSGLSKTGAARIFTAMLWVAVVANTLDFTAHMAQSGIVRLPVTAVFVLKLLMFLNLNLFSYLWFLHSELVSKSRFLNSKALITFSLLPLVLLSVIGVASFFNGCLFYIDDNFVYHRGPLFPAEQFLTFGYILFSFIRSIRGAPLKQNYVHRAGMLSVAVSSVPILLCLALLTFISKIPTVPVGIAISLFLLYTDSMNMRISVDPLTGIPNRMALMKFIEEQISVIKKEEQLCFVFADIDAFKQINDVFGHNEGDRALKIAAGALGRLARKKSAFCARYGGDEFAMIFVLNKNESIEPLKKSIRQCLDDEARKYNLRYKLAASVGCCAYNDKMTVQDLIFAADTAMYSEKGERAKS